MIRTVLQYDETEGKLYEDSFLILPGAQNEYLVEFFMKYRNGFENPPTHRVSV